MHTAEAHLTLQRMCAPLIVAVMLPAITQPVPGAADRDLAKLRRATADCQPSMVLTDSQYRRGAALMNVQVRGNCASSCSFMTGQIGFHPEQNYLLKSCLRPMRNAGIKCYKLLLTHAMRSCCEYQGKPIKLRRHLLGLMSTNGNNS